ncbi:unnamed protein product [Echinostoma caproni]|uniref:Uncharacterized protein n=1 Tax=Echinostoma caproni TaxID=27848 RepID=A0A183A6U1_9TREM|nr:unnamed protein product [Echinostoma caproni]
MISTYSTNWTETPSWFPSVEINTDYRSSLVAMMIFLALILLFMLILLCLPKSAQDTVIRWITRQNPDQSFNYIDVGLYKTRHSMYRKEVYSLAMQTNRRRPVRTKIPSLAPSLSVSERLKQHFDVTSTGLGNSYSASPDRLPDTELVDVLQRGDAQPVRVSVGHKKPELVVTLITSETAPIESGQMISHCSQVDDQFNEHIRSDEESAKSSLDSCLDESGMNELDACTHSFPPMKYSNAKAKSTTRRSSLVSKSAPSIEK